MKFGIVITKCTELTVINTVSADHATAVVNGVRLIVDARTLAILGTEGTALTFIGIEMHLEP